jgi:hypothetical protein
MTQHNKDKYTTLSIVTLSAGCRYDECHSKVHFTECRYAECRYAECRYAECGGVR